MNCLDVENHHLQVQTIHSGGVRVVGMNDELGDLQVWAGFLAVPADDRHPAVGTLVIDQHFPAQVVIEVDLVPRLLQQADALLDGLHPNRIRMRGQERRRAIVGVIQEQDPRHME